MEQSPLQILEQKYGNWYRKILKKENTSLFLKARLRNGYQKITRVIFVRPSWIYLSFLLNPIIPG